MWPKDQLMHFSLILCPNRQGKVHKEKVFWEERNGPWPHPRHIQTFNKHIYGCPCALSWVFIHFPHILSHSLLENDHLLHFDHHAVELDEKREGYIWLQKWSTEMGFTESFNTLRKRFTERREGLSMSPCLCLVSLLTRRHHKPQSLSVEAVIVECTGSWPSTHQRTKKTNKERKGLLFSLYNSYFWTAKSRETLIWGQLSDHVRATGLLK